MAEKPMIFNAEMVRAILKGIKTQTRRVLRPQPVTPAAHVVIKKDKLVIYERGGKQPGAGDINATLSFPLLYGQKGDRLWVRETFRETQEQPGIMYRADGWEDAIAEYKLKWKPSIFMPRKLSRITLEITEVRAERLQQISYEDIRKEGVLRGARKYEKSAFFDLWNKINERRGFSWQSNPWVWVVSFQVINEK